VAPEVSAALQYRFDGAVAGTRSGTSSWRSFDMVATDELRAIRLAAELLGVADLVLPSTTRRVHLIADLLDGRSVHGESEIRGAALTIKASGSTLPMRRRRRRIWRRCARRTQ